MASRCSSVVEHPLRKRMAKSSTLFTGFLYFIIFRPSNTFLLIIFRWIQSQPCFSSRHIIHRYEVYFSRIWRINSKIISLASISFSDMRLSADSSIGYSGVEYAIRQQWAGISKLLHLFLDINKSHMHGSGNAQYVISSLSSTNSIARWIACRATS